MANNLKSSVTNFPQKSSFNNVFKLKSEKSESEKAQLVLFLIVKVKYGKEFITSFKVKHVLQKQKAQTNICIKTREIEGSFPNVLSYIKCLQNHAQARRLNCKCVKLKYHAINLELKDWKFLLNGALHGYQVCDNGQHYRRLIFVAIAFQSMRLYFMIFGFWVFLAIFHLLVLSLRINMEDKL